MKRQKKETEMKPTWKEIEGRLDGVSDGAREIIRRATAPARHEWRVSEAIQAARKWISDDEFLRPFGNLAAWALLKFETMGLYGGGPANPGQGTTRHEAFRGLGKGRRHASDGDVWTAAIRCAADRIYEDGYEIELTDCGLRVNGPDGSSFMADLLLSPEEHLNAVLHLLRDSYPAEFSADYAVTAAKAVDAIRQAKEVRNETESVAS